MKINNKINKNKKQSGFTLIELALVIAGLAIISFGAFVVSGGVLDNARVSSMTNQIQSVKTAVELSNLHTGCLPNDLDVLISNDKSKTTCGGSGSMANWDGPYIQNANISSGKFDLSNIADSTEMNLKTNGSSQVYLEAKTTQTIGEGVVDNLCPGGGTLSIGSLSATTPCGYVGGQTLMVFWIGE